MFLKMCINISPSSVNNEVTRKSDNIGKTIQNKKKVERMVTVMETILSSTILLRSSLNVYYVLSCLSPGFKLSGIQHITYVAIRLTATFLSFRMVNFDPN